MCTALILKLKMVAHQKISRTTDIETLDLALPLLMAALAVMLSVWITTLAFTHSGAHRRTAMPMAMVSFTLMWTSH